MTQVHLDGHAAVPPNLAELLAPAPDLLDDMLEQYLPVGESWRDGGAFWTGFHIWMVERIQQDLFAGTLRADEREALWALWCTGYWVGVELTSEYGMPDAIRALGVDWTVPDETSVADTVRKIGERRAALDGGADALLEYVPTLLREEPVSGALHGAVYNAAV